MDSDSSWAERFYSHFIGRDFAYLFSGGFLICVVEYALYDEIFLPKQISLELFGFLSVSYFLGLVLSSFVIYSNIFKLGYKPPKNLEYKSITVFTQIMIEKNFDGSAFNQLERLYYQRLVGISLGSSSIIGGILMLIITLGRWLFDSVPLSKKYIMLAFGLIFLGILMIKKIGERLSRNIELELEEIMTWVKK